MASGVDIRAKPARELLVMLDFTYPVIIVALFLLLFVAHSIYTAPKIEAPTVTDVLGPGGKPLPRKKKFRASPVLEFGPSQQAMFKWISGLLILTFAADAVLTFAHVIADRQDGWWCGKHFVVRPAYDMKR
jgi:ATP-binding cassette, subfamily B, vacuolar membrane transporter HMT1/ACLQ